MFSGWDPWARPQNGENDTRFMAHSRLHVTVTRGIFLLLGYDAEEDWRQTLGLPLPFFFQTAACKQKGKCCEPLDSSLRPMLGALPSSGWPWETGWDPAQGTGAWGHWRPASAAFPKLDLDCLFCACPACEPPFWWWKSTFLLESYPFS